MKELDICAALAGLEKLESVRIEEGFDSDTLIFWDPECGYKEYSPTVDMAQAFDLMVKYNVDVYWQMEVVNIDDDTDRPFTPFGLTSVQYAICECILKSKGLWK